MRLSEKQRDVLGFIFSFQERYQGNPRQIDIAVEFKRTKQAVSQTCLALKRKGAIKYEGRLSNLIITQDGLDAYFGESEE